MKNKIVIFSNIKGGVGKTTLCALFASYLVERGYPVMAIDADLQASLYRHRKREKDVAPEAPIPWNVDLLDTANREQLELVMAKLKEVPGIVLIDCPGNLNDRNLEYIYKSADTAIIPISFDADTVDATGIFVKALKTVSAADLIFLPNRINVREEIGGAAAKGTDHRVPGAGGDSHADGKAKRGRQTVHHPVPAGEKPARGCRTFIRKNHRGTSS